MDSLRLKRQLVILKSALLREVGEKLITETVEKDKVFLTLY